MVVKKADKRYYRHERDDIPLDPQPTPESLLTIVRFYTKLKRDANYEKRISWFQSKSGIVDSLFHTTALVEYYGVLPPEDSVHGNRKQGKMNYRRTDTKTRQSLKEKVKTAETAKRKLFR